ncbi:MAG: hypothetical protein KC492_14355, partial [Myxococcales bacterium]|nr:hypothetical protein [Myxococcales bacterium]
MEGGARTSWCDLRPGRDGVARSEVIKAYATRFHSGANGMLYRLNRVHFIESVDLRCFAGTTLMFCPIERPWSPPQQYRVGRFGAVLEAAELADAVTQGPVDALSFAKALSGWLRKCGDEGMARDARRLLAQVPHQWAVACDFEGAPTLKGCLVSEGHVGTLSSRRGYLLQPPRHWGGELLRALTERARVSPHGLTFERSFVREGSDIREVSRRVTAALPIAQTLEPAEAWVPRAV